MPQILVSFDEATLNAIDRLAPSSERQPADFIQRAVKDAIFKAETERLREGYRLQPDRAEDLAPWELPEEWKNEAV
jgi:hypothetical protein